MKCTVVFLVLSMVVLMAEPGESFVGLIVKGAFHGTWIHRMKLIVVFLVLSMVVLMAEPGECIFGLIIRGVSHVGGWIHRLIRGRGRGDVFDEQEEQRDKRSIDYNPGRPGFH
ncbi:pleurocidin-like peptide WF3 [Thunnus thynnus]|uniref:pleurocidin-like peptide WF3 n=1 Tax=Thunnus thynnus TaxID=8237 RepID=UPI00352713FA